MCFLIFVELSALNVFWFRDCWRFQNFFVESVFIILVIIIICFVIWFLIVVANSDVFFKFDVIIVEVSVLRFILSVDEWRLRSFLIKDELILLSVLLLLWFFLKIFVIWASLKCCERHSIEFLIFADLIMITKILDIDWIDFENSDSNIDWDTIEFDMCSSDFVVLSYKF